MLRRGILVFGFCIAACGQSEPRSVQFFEANIDEARKVIASCREGTVRNDECGNADVAVQMMEGRERFKRFRSRD